MAIEFELLDSKSFKSSFFDRMEQVNYARYIEGLANNYEAPVFNDG